MLVAPSTRASAYSSGVRTSITAAPAAFADSTAAAWEVLATSGTVPLVSSPPQAASARASVAARSRLSRVRNTWTMSRP